MLDNKSNVQSFLEILDGDEGGDSRSIELELDAVLIWGILALGPWLKGGP